MCDYLTMSQIRSLRSSLRVTQQPSLSMRVHVHVKGWMWHVWCKAFSETDRPGGPSVSAVHLPFNLLILSYSSSLRDRQAESAFFPVNHPSSHAQVAVQTNTGLNELFLYALGSLREH